MFDPYVDKIPWRRKWQRAPVFLPGESHGQRSLASYSLKSCKESNMTERLSMYAYYIYIYHKCDIYYIFICMYINFDIYNSGIKYKKVLPFAMA